MGIVDKEEGIKDNQAFTLDLHRILAQRLREARTEQREAQGEEEK